MDIRFAPIAIALVAGCATTEQVQKLDERVAALEEKVNSGGGARGGSAPAVDQGQEDAAKVVYDALNEAANKGDMQTAAAKMTELKEKFGTTTTYKRAKKMEDELAVIGKAAPSELKVEKWFQGEGQVDISSGKPTLIVFWEVWCPHCRREVPKLKETFDHFASKGLQVVGLTKVTRSATDEKVTEFIKEEGVPYPIAKETGEMSEYFNVSGIPAAAIIKDGKVIWRGHPARLSDDLLNSYLAS